MIIINHQFVMARRNRRGSLIASFSLISQLIAFLCPTIRQGISATTSLQVPTQQQQPNQQQSNQKHYSIFSRANSPPNSQIEIASQRYQQQSPRSQPQDGKHKPTRISSSSSTVVEDLNDSTIRTRFGTLAGPESSVALPPQAAEPLDFENLIDRLLRPIAAPAQQPALVPLATAALNQASIATHKLFSSASPALQAPADANNKTTMRFFRNNKTFASIVYTNEIHGPPPPSGKQRRRLINCHLVDVEKHAPDVALFESKYNIKTIEVEFREMMQLIEACTNIARFKPIRPPGTLLHQMSGKHIFATLKVSDGKSPGSQPSAKMPASYQKRYMAPIVSLASASSSSKPGNLVAQAMSRVGEHGKKLILGEVTTPPEMADQKNGGIREALQEITSYDSTDLLAIWRGILPGTNWCGMGDRATSYNDLGFESDIDICCRAHDFCPIRLSAFTSGFGLFNWSFYTRSHCLCDQNFLDCLQLAQSPLSAVVVKFYFNIMKTTCLRDNETLSALGQDNQQQKQQQQAWWAPLNGPGRWLAGPILGLGNGVSKSMLGPSAELIGSIKSQRPYDREHEQSRLLLDQIRASFPIPALRRSLAVYSKVEARRPAGTPQASKPLEAGYK